MQALGYILSPGSASFDRNAVRLFHAELSAERYWQGRDPRTRGVVGWNYAERYSVPTTMISALRWAAMRAILMFHSL